MVVEVTMQFESGTGCFVSVSIRSVIVLEIINPRQWHTASYEFGK